jgi:hypothetical protein
MEKVALKIGATSVIYKYVRFPQANNCPRCDFFAQSGAKSYDFLIYSYNASVVVG